MTSSVLTTAAFWLLALVLLAVSLASDRAKTAQALKKAWKAFEGILPQFLGIIVLVGILLALLDPATIARLLGSSSGGWGVLIASLVGSVTLIPGFIAFPTAAMLLERGAGYMQLAAFISTLMMVGVVTLPAEIAHFGRKAAVARNVLAYVFSWLVALVVSVVMAL
jgi:uncharacterized membrane protein YraQ (UPF0718 family)